MIRPKKMKEEILINVTPQESRAAVLENGMLQELFIERTSSRGLVGNIYRGKVIRVLPGMQAAFINIGRERSAFLHAAEVLPFTEDLTDKEKQPIPDITELLHDGETVTVQVIKDELGTKGARLTTHLTIPSRYLVLMPDNSHIGISQRIEKEKERLRLKEILTNSDQNKSGYIVRTAAEGASKEELVRDSEFLLKLWDRIKLKIQKTKAPSLVHEDLVLALRFVRDLVPTDVEKIRIDSEVTYQKLSEFLNDFIPTLSPCLEHYNGERPLFDLFNVEDDIEKSLHRKVPLKSGGYLIIEQTEAMVTIDVNTGSFVGYRNLEDTIFKTNLEAASSLARQLRLRNLGGMIIIDFIDMKDEEHKRQVIRTLEKALDKDHAKTHISDLSALGLVQMTRKRDRESLEHLLCEPCKTCDSKGSIKTAQTICYEILRELHRSAKAYEAKQYLVLATQEVVDRMQDEETNHLAELEALINKPVRFQAEPFYSQEQFDVVLI
jgi:ribonuclease G